MILLMILILGATGVLIYKLISEANEDMKAMDRMLDNMNRRRK